MARREAAATKSAAYEVDIGQEFKDVKNEISGLKQEIFAWRNTVDNQLTKLNSNMDRVLNQIADHEGRLTRLETEATKTEGKREAISDVAKFGWWAAKIVFLAGAVIGSIWGAGAVWKFMFGV